MVAGGPGAAVSRLGGVVELQESLAWCSSKGRRMGG